MQEVTTQEQAINVLIQAARIGQSKGVYSLEDAAVILQAINKFVKTPQPADAQVTEEAKG